MTKSRYILTKRENKRSEVSNEVENKAKPHFMRYKMALIFYKIDNFIEFNRKDILKNRKIY